VNFDLAEKGFVQSTFNFSAKCKVWCNGSCWFNSVSRIPVFPVGWRIIAVLCACHVHVLKNLPSVNRRLLKQQSYWRSIRF